MFRVLGIYNFEMIDNLQVKFDASCKAYFYSRQVSKSIEAQCFFKKGKQLFDRKICAINARIQIRTVRKKAHI